MYRKVPSYIWALCPTALLFCLAIAYGSLNFYRDPGSVFYDPSRATERGYSLYREQQALQFRDAVLSPNRDGLSKGPVVWKAGNAPTISGVFLTVHRPSLNGSSHIELSVTSALAGATQPEREDVNLQIYFADTDPTKHPYWNSSLADLVDSSVSPTDIMTKGELALVVELERTKNYMDKVRFDFAYALRHVHRTSASPYIALFEGDIMLADGWIARTISALRGVEKRGDLHWSDMRMFNVENMIGFDSKHPLGNNVPVIILGISAVLFIAFRLLARASRTGREVLTWQFNLVICCITVPAFVILFFRAGKSSMLPPSPGVSIQNWGICSQGMIMPRDVIPGLAAAILANHEQPDRTFLAFAQENGYDRLVLNPIQVQHMGFESFIDPSRKVNTLWSMAFENLRPRILERDHRRMVQELYGKG